MKRREFITLLGGAAVAWPLAASAQQQTARRIGVLMNIAADDPQAATRVATFAQGLAELGWTIGRNVQVDYRWGAGDPERYRKYAVELVELAPDVILGVGVLIVEALQRTSRSMPIVFVSVTDPVSAGVVESLARPGGNATGFLSIEFGTSGKWLELLKDIAPRVTRVGVMRNPVNPTSSGHLGAIQAVAPLFGVELRPIDARDAGEIERAVTAFARAPDGGLIVPRQAPTLRHREMIIALAFRYRLPAVYSDRVFITGGGLASYGPDSNDEYRHAAGYIARILMGEKPADLPVQAPTKYELAINLKTAKALGLTVSDKLLALADEVIE
jgi:putative tryptophan/tyrosine transport system substrate-binding protein